MSEVFSGTVEVQDAAANTTVLLDGNAGDIAAGGAGQDGEIIVRDAVGNPRVRLLSSGGVLVRDAAGNAVLQLHGTTGDITIWHMVSGSNREVLHFEAANAILRVGGQDHEGDLIVQDGAARQVFHFDGDNATLYVGAAGNEGDIFVRNAAGDATVHVDGGEGDLYVRRRIAKVMRSVLQFDASAAALYVGTTGSEGDIIVRDGEGRDVFHFDGGSAALYVGASGNEGDIFVRDSAGRDVFHMNGESAALYVGADGNEGDIIVRDQEGREVFHFSGDHAVLDVGADGNEGDIRVRDENGTVRIHLDGGAGDIKLFGADCAEEFDVRDPDSVDEGSVVVIDGRGALRESVSAYDRRVAGVVSGAGGLRPGLVLDKQGAGPGRRPVALVGKVYCKVDAGYGPVEVGDLLTTSDTPGHAMKAADPLRAFGAVIGKALAPLVSGRGQVPILVALQ